MTLRIGDELVKKRGGGKKRVTVTALDKLSATLAPVGVVFRHGRATRWEVELDEDGLPKGYKLAVKP